MKRHSVWPFFLILIIIGLVVGGLALIRSGPELELPQTDWEEKKETPQEPPSGKSTSLEDGSKPDEDEKDSERTVFSSLLDRIGERKLSPKTVETSHSEPDPYEGWSEAEHRVEQQRARKAARAKLEAIIYGEE